MKYQILNNREILVSIANRKTFCGQSLVELILVMGLSALLLPALLAGFMVSRERKAQQGQRMQAIALLKETETALRNARNNDWNTIATNGTYHLTISGSSWVLQSSSQTTNGLTQQVAISDTYRDTSGSIVTMGGIVDPSTKKIVITISWSSPTPSSITSTLYLTRTTNYTSYDTTQTDFSTGTASGAAVASTSGSLIPNDGHVQLSTGGHGNWCSPSLALNTLDLPGSGYASSVKAIEGKAFVGTGENSSGLTYMGVNINNADPPVATFESTFDGYKTNDVFGEIGYAYVATDANAKEAVIINTASVPYTESGYFNAPGNGSGEGIYVSNSVGYVITGTKLYNFNLSSKSGSRLALDSDGVTLASTGEKVIVVGNYAYVVINATTSQLQIIDISNTSDMQVVGSVTVTGQGGRDVYVNSSGTRAYLATATSSTQRELFIIDITTKTSPQVIGNGYEANGMDPKGVVVVPGNIAVLVGSNGEEYQIINIVSETNPERCGGAQVDSGVHGIASVLEADGDAYSYIVTGDATAEFKIIQGGAGGSFTASATFESRTFDATASSAFNRLVATVAQPAATTIKMQVAVRTPISGSCPTTSSSYTFVGPNGDTNAYFIPVGASISGAIPFGTYGTNYQNPQRCFRYKAWLDTTDITQSPFLYDMTWNYSQ